MGTAPSWVHAANHVGNLDRTTYVGSSDAASILGLSKFEGGTRLGVYYKKIGEPLPISPELEQRFKNGKRQEPIIIDIAEEMYGIDIVRRSTEKEPNRYRDPECAFMAAEIDVEFRVTEKLHEKFPGCADIPVGTLLNGECKNSHPFVINAMFGEDQSGDIDAGYEAQVQYAMMVTGRQHCLVFVGDGTGNLLAYRIDRDEEVIAGMRKQVVDFWTNNVLARVPPEPVNLPDLVRLIGRRNGVPVECDLDTARLVNQLGNIRARMATEKADEQDLVFRIGDYMRTMSGFPPDIELDNALLIFGGRPILSWKRTFRAGYVVEGGEYRVMRKLKV